MELAGSLKLKGGRLNGYNIWRIQDLKQYLKPKRGYVYSCCVEIWVTVFSSFETAKSFPPAEAEAPAVRAAYRVEKSVHRTTSEEGVLNVDGSIHQPGLGAYGSCLVFHQSWAALRQRSLPWLACKLGMTERGELRCCPGPTPTHKEAPTFYRTVLSTSPGACFPPFRIAM